MGDEREPWRQDRADALLLAEEEDKRDDAATGARSMKAFLAAALALSAVSLAVVAMHLHMPSPVSTPSALAPEFAAISAAEVATIKRLATPLPASCTQVAFVQPMAIAPRDRTCPGAAGREHS
jgi:hypothetical protein